MSVDLTVLIVLAGIMVLPMAATLLQDRLGQVPSAQRATDFVHAVLVSVGIGVVLTMGLWGWDVLGWAAPLLLAWFAADAVAMWLVRRLEL
jgi:hypothetical protein